MLVKDFAALLDIFKLADSNTRDICILPDGSYLMAMHCWAMRRPSGCAIPIKEPLTVDGAAALGAVALFDQDAELTIKQADASLVLSAKGRRALLRTKPASAPPEEAYVQVKGEKIKAAKLRDTIPFLVSCTAGAIGTSPILGGIEFRSIGSNGKSRLAATDQERRSGTTTISLAIGKKAFVVPAADLQKALDQLGSKLVLKFHEGHLLLSDGATTISLSLLAGAFPSLKSLPRPKQFTKSVNIPSDAVQTAIRAALLFDADRMLAFVLDKKRAAFVVQGQETGGFRVPIGKREGKDITIMLDGGMLEALPGLDKTVVMHYKDERSPLLFTDQKARRLLWILPLVRG